MPLLQSAQHVTELLFDASVATNKTDKIDLLIQARLDARINCDS